MFRTQTLGRFLDTNRRAVLIAACLLLFMLAGLVLLARSSAASYSLGLEAESGTVTGKAAKQSIEGASQNQAVRFGNNGGAPTDTVKIMPMGSSTIVGVGSSNGAGFRPAVYQKLTAEDGLDINYVGSQNSGPASLPDKDHEGHSGWTLSNINGSVNGWMATYQPDVILMYAGMNDLWLEAKSGAEVAGRFEAVAAKVFAAKPDAILLAANTFQHTTDSGLNARIRDYNARLLPIAEKYRAQGRYLRIVDFDSVITSADHHDAVHANDAGYAKMTTQWLAAIRAAYPSL